MSVKLSRYVFKRIGGRIVPIRVGAFAESGTVKEGLRGISRKALRAIDAVRNKATQKRIAEFTKDSVVKHSVFHGTNASFRKFSHDKIGSSTGTALGRGFYFTDKKNTALGYGKKVKEFFLNLKKPLTGSLNDTISGNNISEKQITKMVKGEDLSNWGQSASAESVAKQLKKYNTNDLDVIQDVGTSVYHNNWRRALSRVRKVTGIDGVVAGNKEVTHYVAFNSDQIMPAPKRSDLYKKIQKIKYRNKK